MLGGDRPPRARAAPEAPPSGTARSYALMRLRQEQISARGELVATSGGYRALRKLRACRAEGPARPDRFTSRKGHCAVFK